MADMRIFFCRPLCMNVPRSPEAVLQMLHMWRCARIGVMDDGVSSSPGTSQSTNPTRPSDETSLFPTFSMKAPSGRFEILQKRSTEVQMESSILTAERWPSCKFRTLEGCPRIGSRDGCLRTFRWLQVLFASERGNQGSFPSRSIVYYSALPERCLSRRLIILWTALC